MSTSTKIVLIDDDHAWLNTLADYFQGKGANVRTAPGGAVGLALIEQEGADLAVVDFHMPEMDGLEFLSQARKRNLTVVVLSSDEDPALASRAAALGAAMYLSKNMPAALLLEKLCEVLLASAQTALVPVLRLETSGNARFLPVPVHLLLTCGL